MGNKVNIKIKYFHDDLEHVQEVAIGDWIDLRCAEEVHLKQGEFKLIPLGVAMELPKGYEGWLTSRSSLCKNFGVFHCDDLGVIDSSYCGDNDQWHLPVLAVRDTVIHKNDRIAQFRIHRTMREECGEVSFTNVEHLNNPDRGGIGSSGTNEFLNK